MKNAVISCLLCLFLIGCKSKKNIISYGSIDENLNAKEIISKHQQSFPNFKTLTGSVLATYDDGKNTQSVLLSLRMERDKAIWFSAPLGVAKIYITPEKTSYYNRLDNTFFEGDFSYIGKLLGFEVDFHSLQNLLLGQAIYKFSKKENFKLSSAKSDYYILKSTENTPLNQTYGFTPDTYRVALINLTDGASFEVDAQYTYQEVNQIILPSTLKIKIKEKKNTSINLDFKAIELDQNIHFPFKIPSGMKEIK